MRLQKIANDINLLSEFCGKRDINKLSKDELMKHFGISCADVLILFGGSILEGCNVCGEGMKSGIAKELILVGGEGHTTEALRQVIKKECPEIQTANKTEAVLMGEYLNLKYNIKDYYLETKSTNCGNNVTYVLELLKENNIKAKNIIIIQDSTMQQRMDAGFRKYSDDINIINYAPYKAKVVVKNDKLAFEESNILGMWNLEKYISLLMGEIPRLHDDENGYGPNGTDYIAHVHVPSDVLKAFENLKAEYGNLVRVANPLYASSLK